MPEAIGAHPAPLARQAPVVHGPAGQPVAQQIPPTQFPLAQPLLVVHMWPSTAKQTPPVQANPAAQGFALLHGLAHAPEVAEQPYGAQSVTMPTPHCPEPLQVRLLVKIDPAHVAAAHAVPPDFCAHIPAPGEPVATQAPVLPQPMLVVSGAQAVAQQIPVVPVELGLTQNPLAQSAPLFGLLAVLHACPLGRGIKHWVFTQM